MSTQVVGTIHGYRALRAAKRIAVVDGTIVLGLLGWAVIDYIVDRRRA